MGKTTKTVKALKTNVDTALRNVAAEYFYAKDLQLKLQKIESEESDKAIQDARKGLHILRYLTRAEKTSYKYEENVLRELKELKPLIPNPLQLEAEKLLSGLLIFEQKLVKIASSFGDLQQEINKIAVDEALLKKITDSNQLRSQLGLLCRQAKAAIDSLLTWIAGTEELFRETQAFANKLDEIVANEDD